MWWASLGPGFSHTEQLSILTLPMCSLCFGVSLLFMGFVGVDDFVSLAGSASPSLSLVCQLVACHYSTALALDHVYSLKKPLVVNV
jgi:hypothetical protein